MTAVSDTDVDRPEIEVVDDDPPPPTPRRPIDSRRLLGVGVVGLLLVLASYLFFGAFVTHLWYETRQRALASAGLSLVKPKIGAPVGVLQVEQPFVLNTEIVEGDTAAQLRSGPGHAVDTPLPGSLGNSVVYGHDTEWGGPFVGLSSAVPGTQLYLRTASGSLLVYRVIADRTISAAATVAYLGTSTDYRLTLVTGAGGRFSDRRTVVVAVSGTEGALSAPKPHTKAGPVAPDPVGITLFELVGWMASAASVGALLWRSHRRTLVVAAMVPMVLAMLVCGFLEMNLALSPLA